MTPEECLVEIADAIGNGDMAGVVRALEHVCDSGHVSRFRCGRIRGSLHLYAEREYEKQLKEQSNEQH